VAVDAIVIEVDNRSDGEVTDVMCEVKNRFFEWSGEIDEPIESLTAPGPFLARVRTRARHQYARQAMPNTRVDAPHQEEVTGTFTYHWRLSDPQSSRVRHRASCVRMRARLRAYWGLAMTKISRHRGVRGARVAYWKIKITRACQQRQIIDLVLIWT
jgi:hypothetical protein